jgi:hypothetical protein
MIQPKGFEVPRKEHQVCRLKKALYGLQQASKAWCFNIDFVFHYQGLQQSVFDHNLYYNIYSDVRNIGSIRR